MNEAFSRTQLLLGRQAMERLFSARVAIFGVGGVGGHCTEALARSGIGTLHLYDNDQVNLSNLNRQIIALHSTVGRDKTEVMRERILDINPGAHVECFSMFYGPQNADQVDLSQYDCVVDAIDTVTSKVELICRASQAGTPIISSMGSGNKLDPTAFRLTDLSKTSSCPLARVIRRELRRRGITHLPVVFSSEEPLSYAADAVLPRETAAPDDTAPRRSVPASNSFVPAAAGLVLASAVVRSIALDRPLCSFFSERN